MCLALCYEIMLSCIGAVACYGSVVAHGNFPLAHLAELIEVRAMMLEERDLLVMALLLVALAGVGEEV